MATSPIFGWEEPDDTDLVKDGASAIRTLGNAIDTTMGTMVAKTIIDAKGDLIVGSAADTAARLAVGSNDQVLIADSTATNGVKWGTPTGGGMTQIAQTDLRSTGAATLTFSSIPTTYKSLKLVHSEAKNDSGASKYFLCTINGDTASNYYNTMASDQISPSNNQTFNSYSVGASKRWANDTIAVIGMLGTNYYSVDGSNGTFEFDNPSSTGTKYWRTVAAGNNGAEPFITIGSGRYTGSSAITSILLKSDAGNIQGLFTLYGVN